MRSNRIIDSHQHFWRYDAARYSWLDDSMAAIRKDFLPEDLQVQLNKNKVEGCIAVQADQSEAETEFLLKLAKQHDFIKGVVGWVDLSAENVSERLKYFANDNYFKGVRHTVWDEKGEFMLAPSFLNGIAYLSTLNLSYDILAFDYQLASAVKMVEQFPKQKFVLDHMGKPNFFEKPSNKWVDNIQELAKHFNVSCKLSGMHSDAAHPNPTKENLHAYLKILMEEFGEERLLFGSDWPVHLISENYETVMKLVKEYFSNFPPNHLEKVMGLNAVNFYKL